MKNFRKLLVAIVVVAIVFNIVVHWHHVNVLLAWIVALAGWVPHLFDKKEQHGN
jgi:Flp pilus assembly protein TadB